MPRGGGAERGRGRKKNHKGQRRMFTDEDELKQQAEKDEKAKAWRKQCGIESSDEEEEAKPEADGATAKKVGDLPPSDSSSEESSEEEAKPSGVSHLIEIENPNRQGTKAARKISELSTTTSTQLSRREREQLEKQEARRKYEALHAEGKTDEARADLARLAIIRKQREDAARKRDEEKNAAAAASKGKS